MFLDTEHINSKTNALKALSSSNLNDLKMFLRKEPDYNFKYINIYDLCIAPRKFAHLEYLFYGATNFSGDYLFKICCEKNNPEGLNAVMKFIDIPPSFVNHATSLFIHPERYECFKLFINHRDTDLSMYPSLTPELFENQCSQYTGTSGEKILREIAILLKTMKENPISVRYNVQTSYHEMYKTHQSIIEFLAAYKNKCIAEINTTKCNFFQQFNTTHEKIKK